MEHRAIAAVVELQVAVRTLGPDRRVLFLDQRREFADRGEHPPHVRAIMVAPYPFFVVEKFRFVARRDLRAHKVIAREKPSALGKDPAKGN